MQANISMSINCKEGVTKTARHCSIKQIMRGDYYVSFNKCKNEHSAKTPNS